MLKSWDMTGKSRLCCCSGSAQQTSDHIQEDERTNRQTTKTQIYKKKLSSFSPFGKSAKKVKWTISPSTFRYLEKCGTDIGMKKTKIWFDMNFTIIWLFWFTRFILVKSGFLLLKRPMTLDLQTVSSKIQTRLSWFGWITRLLALEKACWINLETSSWLT